MGAHPGTRRVDRRRVGASLLLVPLAGIAALAPLLSGTDATPRHPAKRSASMQAASDVASNRSFAASPRFRDTGVVALGSLEGPPRGGAPVATSPDVALLASITRFGAIATAAVSTAALLRSAVLGTQVPLRMGQLLVVGRTTCESGDGHPPFTGATVTLSALLPAGDEELSYFEELPIALAHTPIELRPILQSALSRSPRRMIVPIAETATGPDGRFVFLLDRTRLPSPGRIAVVAVASIGDRKHVAATEAELPSAEPAESGSAIAGDTLDVSSLALEPTTRLVLRATRQGAPVVGAPVEVKGGAENLLGVTDSAGFYEAEVRPGSVVSVRAPGLSIGARKVPSAASSELAVELLEERSLDVCVTDSHGAPVARATVSALTVGDAWVTAEEADDAGRATLSGLAAGEEYTIAAEGPEESAFARTTAKVKLPAGPLTLVLQPSGSLEIDVVVAQDLPATLRSADVRWDLQVRDPDQSWRSVKSYICSPGATIHVAPLDAGVYRVTLSADESYRIAPVVTDPIEVVPGAPAQTTLEVMHGRTVTAWLVDQNYEPLDGSIALAGTNIAHSLGDRGWLQWQARSKETRLEIRIRSHAYPITVRPDQTYLGLVVISVEPD